MLIALWELLVKRNPVVVENTLNYCILTAPYERSIRKAAGAKNRFHILAKGPHDDPQEKKWFGGIVTNINEIRKFVDFSRIYPGTFDAVGKILKGQLIGLPCLPWFLPGSMVGPNNVLQLIVYPQYDTLGKIVKWGNLFLRVMGRSCLIATSCNLTGQPTCVTPSMLSAYLATEPAENLNLVVVQEITHTKWGSAARLVPVWKNPRDPLFKVVRGVAPRYAIETLRARGLLIDS
ncbi:hypothetical protein A3K34_01210 [candidate division WWE3 bacterium RIFOXYC1_FULL_40_10]|nr:MAG: hypothetical protein A3K58_01210 [candidate division WWE3 bacterium RIFOXYB1_FULL_40_22]OGC61488.1 MAG: hypothetical protein A3K37_01210 [candidate division WWE3 bacterium RIFOXYA1_FULL_40_11]OGC65871.1 MAG: hypothetical protein A3K34_01210 [candidate division WWE3 bacterium RIFOXYC1_FULL_40_10]OGC71173.1 MAG: hypothetical protein A2602_01645 [candidate division WWE3 bacterium RIFOXYD1_FULL_40_11]